ncbi:MAG TPA: polysaccharide deacetylase family protein [Falsiroseomonas sp.]|jgi:peptidoglycan/xylan/chitin deacetylase (PgdA/CDA1 family)|nr:polysaccharide deacetylase family protein [Falsiroseomonas sp.]
MVWETRRDFVGYGGQWPDPRWPGGARIAVNFVLNYEEGSEPSVQDGEGFSETNLSEAHGRNQIARGRDLAAESLFEYGSRVGAWRVLRIFEERGLPMTIFACALALERNPPMAAAIAQSGHDICGHGWRWIKHFELDEATERDHIARAIASLQRTVGRAPEGWYCRYGPSENTRRLLMEHDCFVYDSDHYGDELPFWMTVEGRPRLIVPYSLCTNDTKFYAGVGNSEQWFTFCRDHFDLLWEEADSAGPRMMSIGLHPRIIGQPARAVGLIRLLDHMASRGDVWFARRSEIARHWMEQHPFPGKGLNE